MLPILSQEIQPSFFQGIRHWLCYCASLFSIQVPGLHHSYVSREPETSIKQKCYKKYSDNGKRVVHNMPLLVFQERLVVHFDTRFKQKSIVRPTRIKTPSVVCIHILYKPIDIYISTTKHKYEGPTL